MAPESMLAPPPTPARTPDTGGSSDPRPPLRVAMVSEYYYPHLGGVTEHVHYLSRELRRLGCHVDIVTSTIEPGDVRDHVVRVGRSVPIYSNRSMARLTVAPGLRSRLRSLFRDQRYDVVHVHCPLAPTLPIAAIRAAEVPVVGTFHTWFPRSRAYEVARPYLQRAVVDRLDVAIAVSPSAAEAHARHFVADWQIIPNGIDTNEFHPHVEHPAAIPPGTPTILFVGRFDPRNELGALIEAFPLVQRAVPDARLVVVGDGPLRRHYRAMARGNPAILFAGALTSERAAYYAAATVYACPTTRASFGVTLLEAMASGTPIVCTDLDGFRSVATPGREAIMTPAHDITALAQALIRVLHDPELRARMSAHGLLRAQHFQWPRVAAQVLDAYHLAGARVPTHAVA